jgi:HEAT repeat protein
MPREQLLGLAADVNRLLAAGSSAAAGHDGLARRARALREAGAKIPALTAVADAVERVTAAAPKQAGPAFLDLVLLARQLRASLSAVGVEGKAEPPPPSGPWQTPGAAGDVYPAHEALTRSGSGGRAEALDDAIKRNRVGDLRLASALLAGLEDGSSGLADMVAKQALPAVGQAVLPDLKARLDLQGKAADARRLLAICKIDARAGAELCRKALAEGSPALRIQALECLPEVGRPGEAEQAGLAHCRDKKLDVRQAALSALRLSKSDEALSALLAPLEEPDWSVYHTAKYALSELPHPKATARLVEGLNARVAALPAEVPLPKGGGKKAAALRAEAEKANRQRELQLDYILRNVETLGDRKRDTEAIPGALVLLARHPEARLRAAAVTALGQLGVGAPQVVSALAEALSDRETDVAEAAAEALGHLAPAQREAALPAALKMLENLKVQEDVGGALLHLLPEHMERFGPAILERLRLQLQSKNYWLLDAVETALQEIGPAARPLLPDLLERLRAGDGDMNYAGVFVAVEPEGGTTVPALVQLLAKAAKPNVRLFALGALTEYGPKARAAEAVVSGLLKDRSAAVKQYAQAALERIRGE